MTTAPAEAPKDKTKAADAPVADAIVTERGKRFEEDQDASVRSGGRHEGPDETEATEDDPFAVSDADKAHRLSNTHHGHVLTALRLLHAESEETGTVPRDRLAWVLEMMEAAHSQPVPQPESGSTVHGTTGPGAPPDIHHTPFSRSERHRQPGQ